MRRHSASAYSPKPIDHARNFRVIFRGLFFSSRRRTPVSNLTSACEDCREDTRYARWPPKRSIRAPPAPPPCFGMAALGASDLPRSTGDRSNDPAPSADVQSSDRSSVLGVSVGPQRIVWRRHGRYRRLHTPRVAVERDAGAEELATPASHSAAAGRSATVRKIFWSLATTPAPRWYGPLEEKPR
jgi:hypothetical protein